jgi:hypothetical protein
LGKALTASSTLPSSSWQTARSTFTGGIAGGICHAEWGGGCPDSAAARVKRSAVERASRAAAYAFCSRCASISSAIVHVKCQ